MAIREPSQITIRRNWRILENEEETSEEERQRAWEIRTRIREKQALPWYTKYSINVERPVLRQMKRFNDPKMQAGCKGRLAKGRKTKMLHQPSLRDLEAEDKFVENITGMGFEWLLEFDLTEVPIALAQEFFTSFRFKATSDVGKKSINFRTFGKHLRMDLTEWSVRLGLYKPKSAKENPAKRPAPKPPDPPPSRRSLP